MQLLDAMNKDSGIPLMSLKVDGGMTANSLLMQIQSDILGIPVGKTLDFSRLQITHFKTTYERIDNCSVFGSCC